MMHGPIYIRFIEIPVQSFSGPEGPRRLRISVLKTIGTGR